MSGDPLSPAARVTGGEDAESSGRSPDRSPLTVISSVWEEETDEGMKANIVRAKNGKPSSF
jgi:hypothetical protein